MHTAIIVLGFLLAWGMVVAVGFLIWKTGSAKVWKDNFSGMKEARDMAEERELDVQRKLDEMIHEHKDALKLIGDQKRIIERLEALPNLQKIIEFMADERKQAEHHWEGRLQEVTQRVQGAIDEHDSDAERRHQEIIALLDRGDN